MNPRIRRKKQAAPGVTLISAEASDLRTYEGIERLSITREEEVAASRLVYASH